IKGDDFKALLETGASDEEIAKWVDKSGSPKSEQEKREWSEQVMRTNCGQVRGPVQLAFARSVDPIVSSEHAITRMAVATEREAEAQQGDNRTMGRKFTVPYALYRAHGFVNPFLADDTGFSDDDLQLL